MKLINARITNAGLYYIGHYNSYHVRLEFQLRGGGAAVTFPVKRVCEFLQMFSNDLNPEDGVFVHDLKDINVRLKLDDNGQIVGIGDILAEEDEMFELSE